MLEIAFYRRVTAAAAACLLLSFPGFSQEPDVQEQLEALRRGQEQLQMQIQLMKDVQQLKEGMAEIRKEIAEIKTLLQARPASAPAARAAAEATTVENVAFDIGANPVKGERTAPLTLIEFTDYQ
jgi:ribosomal protein L29